MSLLCLSSSFQWHTSLAQDLPGPLCTVFVIPCYGAIILPTSLKYFILSLLLTPYGIKISAVTYLHGLFRSHNLHIYLPIVSFSGCRRYVVLLFECVWCQTRTLSVPASAGGVQCASTLYRSVAQRELRYRASLTHL